MIDSDVIKNTTKLAASFSVAKPFRHIVIDNFFSASNAHTLLTDFPKFEKKYALNETGEVGGKAVITDIKAVSPHYQDVYRYLNSKAFLSSISNITGISDLIADPQLYGGGTHDNIDGQELDAHIDYNYINGGNLHRRLNIILYLNHEWEADWGGSIELHSNPRKPDEDQISAILPLFNRALIFETNEYSWHGFSKITLPIDKKQLTRKSLAIYLYTVERPKAEIAPHHSTFYVQRPLPDYIKEGFTLDAESVQALKILLTRRDDAIEFYQQATFEHNVKLSRIIYRALPISAATKEKVKNFIFSYAGFLLKNRTSYTNWKNKQSKN